MHVTPTAYHLDGQNVNMSTSNMRGLRSKSWLSHTRDSTTGSLVSIPSDTWHSGVSASMVSSVSMNLSYLNYDQVR